MFDPLEDSHTLNTFTRRDHLFARLEFLLEKGGVTLFHQDKVGGTLHENGVIQLEFSGLQKQKVVHLCGMCCRVIVCKPVQSLHAGSIITIYGRDNHADVLLPSVGCRLM